MMMLRIGILTAVLLVAAAEPCRDRFLWPFAASNPFNMPIGLGAQFEPSDIYNLSLAAGCALRMGPSVTLRRTCPGWNTSWTPGDCVQFGCCWDPIESALLWCYYPGGRPPMYGFHNDKNIIAIASAADPLTDWISQGDWGPDDKCAITGKVATQVPLPVSLAIGCDGGNNAMGLLLPDNRTLLQMQPAYRAPAPPGAPLLAQYHAGCPVPFPWAVDILSDAPWGAHGGSGLSSVAGTIRAGELRPGAPPLRHALQLELFAHDYYSSGGADAPYAECFRWPALGCDGYAHDAGSALCYNGTQRALRPGALLALPPAARALPTATAPGAALRDALAAFGGYIVDDTADDSAAVCMEAVVSAELLADYGIVFASDAPARPGVNAATTAFYGDLVAIFQALAVVVNNANGTAGGGGAPLVPLAPPICGADEAGAGPPGAFSGLE